MPHVDIGAPHQLGREEALRRLKQKVELLQQTYGSKAAELQMEWTDNVLQFKVQALGMRISGTATVEESEVQVHADIPLTALPFRGLVERRVKDDLAQMLA
jgi:hypothetical protein